MHTQTSSTVSNLATTLVELDSIVQNLLLLLSDKEKTVIVKRFNLDGSRKHTLEEIGKEFSVTRERIRQIEKNALTKMRRNVFNTALVHVHNFSDIFLGEGGGLSKEDLLIERLLEDFSKESDLKVDVNAVRLALSLHDDLERVGNTIDFHPYVKRKGISDYALRNTSHKAVDQLHKHGDIKQINKLEKELAPALKEFKLDAKLFQALMHIDKRLKVVDMDKVGLFEWRHIHPRTLRDKIFFILRTEKKPLHFVAIAEKISSKNFDNRSVNVQAVHNELIRHKQFVLIGRGIYALTEWGYEKGTVADVIIKVLKEKKELTQDDIIKAVLDRRQVKEITIVLALKNNSRFERVGRKRYKLVK